MKGAAISCRPFFLRTARLPALSNILSLDLNFHGIGGHSIHRQIVVSAILYLPAVGRYKDSFGGVP
jgi:hypothetical protein